MDHIEFDSLTRDGLSVLTGLTVVAAATAVLMVGLVVAGTLQRRRGRDTGWLFVLFPAVFLSLVIGLCILDEHYASEKADQAVAALATTYGLKTDGYQLADAIAFGGSGMGYWDGKRVEFYVTEAPDSTARVWVKADSGYVELAPGGSPTDAADETDAGATELAPRGSGEETAGQ